LASSVVAIMVLKIQKQCGSVVKNLVKLTVVMQEKNLNNYE